MSAVADGSPAMPGLAFRYGTQNGAFVDINASAYTTSAYAQWSGFDDESSSGVRSYLVQVRTAADGTPVSDWQEMFDNSGNVLITTPLQQGQKYVVAVRALNRAGAFSARTDTDGFVFDSTPPLILGLNVSTSVVWLPYEQTGHFSHRDFLPVGQDVPVQVLCR